MGAFPGRDVGDVLDEVLEGGEGGGKEGRRGVLAGKDLFRKE